MIDDDGLMAGLDAFLEGERGLGGSIEVQKDEQRGG